MRSTLRQHLLASTLILGAASVASPAWAQAAQGEQAGQPAEAAEAIIVTGSRIARRDLTSTSPVAVVADEEFKLSGAVNVEQVINTLPQVVPGATSFSNNPGGGVATLDLRGLGSTRTMVMVNGRRWMFFDTSQRVDLNTIPQFLLESVDVVTGGASAVYGSDAIAGVVNFRLKETLQGIEAGGQYAITEKGDGVRWGAHLALGTEFADGRGHITTFAEYFKRKPVFQSARGFSRFALGDDDNGLVPAGSATTPQGRMSIAARQTVASVCSGKPGDPGVVALFEGWGGDTNCNGITNGAKVNGVVQVDPGDRAGLARALGTNYGSDYGANFGSPGVSDVFDFPGELYNYAPANYLQVPQERWLIGGYGAYEIADGLTAFMEVAFVNNRVANELAATPVTGTYSVNIAKNAQYLSAADVTALNQIDANEAIINQALIDRCNANNAANVGNPDFTPANCAVAGNLPGAGVVSMSIGRRVIETGSRNSLDERNAFRALAGIRGDVFGDFNYEAYYSYSRTRNSNIQAGNISRSAFANAVLNGTINIWGAGTLTPAMVDSISILAQNSEMSNLQVAFASFSGPLGNFGLGAEDIGIAIGAEWRSQSSAFVPDTALSSGDVIGFNAGDPTSGGYNVKEVFGELRLPIIADRPGFHRLELHGAARYSDYSLKDVGGVWAYAGGIEWAPIKDIGFRAQYQRSVRAPNVGELFGGLANGFPPATDPCSSRGTDQSATVRALCEATGVPDTAVFSAGLQPNSQIEGTFGGNPNLREETSDTYTVGAVIRPSFIPRLNIAIDYFNIKIDNLIDTFGGGLNNTLALCYNIIQDINSPYCQALIGARDPSTGIIGDKFLPEILDANIASRKTSGVDLQVDYTVPLTFGLMGEESRLSMFFLGTYTHKNDFTPVVDQPDIVNHCAGRFGLICDTPQPKYKWTTRLSWIDGPLTSSLRWRYMSSVRDDDDSTDYVVEKLKPYGVVDFSASLDVNDNITLSAGVNNLFNKKPQLIGDNQEQANTYPSVYDVLGRDYFVSAKFRF